MRWIQPEDDKLARLLCGNPRRSLMEAMNQIWNSDEEETEAERALCQEMERDWDLRRYERLCDFLVSADGARIRKLLVVDTECELLAQQLVVTCNWLSIGKLCLDTKDPEKQAKVEGIREQFTKEKERFNRLCKELETALGKLN